MTSSEPSVRKTMEFFSAKNLDDRAPNKEGPSPEKLKISYRDEADKEAFLEGSAIFSRYFKNSAFAFDDCGMHIGVVEFAPGLPSPLHSHSDNCVYYVERGSLIMGNREIGPGEGFLTRKDQPYGFVAGPDGARIIEFTTGHRDSIAIHDRNIAGWKKRLEKAAAKINATWRTNEQSEQIDI
jgi:hypothetical protein